MGLLLLRGYGTMDKASKVFFPSKKQELLIQRTQSVLIPGLRKVNISARRCNSGATSIQNIGGLYISKADSTAQSVLWEPRVDPRTKKWLEQLGPVFSTSNSGIKYMAQVAWGLEYAKKLHLQGQRYGYNLVVVAILYLNLKFRIHGYQSRLAFFLWLGFILKLY